MSDMDDSDDEVPRAQGNPLSVLKFNASYIVDTWEGRIKVLEVTLLRIHYFIESNYIIL